MGVLCNGGRVSDPIVIASWIVTVLPEKLGAARRAFASIPGARLCATAEPVVLTTECPEREFPALHGALSAVPGVRSVSMVAAYREKGDE